MRPLTIQQARECENALPSDDKKAWRGRCRCRCMGKLHGANRIKAGVVRSAYADLPVKDPHHVPLSKAYKRKLKKEAHDNSR
jgi:hypothetical protein